MTRDLIRSLKPLDRRLTHYKLSNEGEKPDGSQNIVFQDENQSFKKNIKYISQIILINAIIKSDN